MPTVNRPPVQGVNASEYISVLDIEKPVIMDKLFERKDDQWGEYFMWIMKSFGFELPVNQTSYSHFEDDDWIRPIKLGGSLSSGQGGSQAAFNVTLHADDVFTDGGATPAAHLFPRVGDIFMFPQVTGGVADKTAVVTAVTPGGPTVTLKFQNSAWTTDALSSGAYLILAGGQFAEGSGMPDGVIDNLIKKTNYTHIIKEAWGGTGTEMTNGKWVTVTSGGRSIRMFYADGQHKMDHRMLYKIDGTLMHSNLTSSSPGIVDPLSGTNRKMQSTMGLLPWIRQEGEEIPYPIGGFTMSKFDFIAKRIANQKGGKTYMWLHGFDLGTEIENTLTDFLKNTAVDYTSNSDQQEMIVRIGFKSVIKNGVTHLFKFYGNFNNQNSYGLYPSFQNRAVLLPVGRAKAYKDQQKSEYRDAPMFGYRYKMDGNINRKMVVATLNGINGYNTVNGPVHVNDTSGYYSLSDIGFEGMCGNKFFILQGQ